MNPAAIGKRAVKIAQADVGIKESPPGSNSQKFGKFWGEDGVAWCGLAVGAWWKLAGFRVPKELALKIDYIPEMVRLATNNEYGLKLVSKAEVRPGDALAYDFPRADGTADHTGLFKEWIDKEAGEFYAIEGNTGTTNQSNGGEVMVRRRNMSNVQAMIRPTKV